jgi:hypothetical protein
MGIDIHCDIDAAMAEQFLYQFWVRPRAKQDGSGAMPQIVQPHAWKPGMLEQSMKLSQQGIGVEIASLAYW